MEAGEISVVMTRASELHASICDAIDRASKSRLLRNGSSRVFGDDGEEDEEEVPEFSTEEELRSLEGIRDALEMLESQLESLQSVQQQQRIRKDAALAELEESRRTLLQRLKEHEGREMQVVEEAMTFAGEPVKKMDDLPLPPYLHPVSPSIISESPVFRQAKVEKSTVDTQLEDNFSFYDPFQIEEAVTDLDEVPTEMHINDESGPPSGRFSRVFSGILNFTGKTVLVVASVIAFLAFSDFDIKSLKGSESRKQHHAESKPSSRSHSKQQPAPQIKPDLDPKPTPKPVPILECPVGYKQIEENGVVKCIVKERVELPFPREIKTPDVLHGRG